MSDRLTVGQLIQTMAERYLPEGVEPIDGEQLSNFLACRTKEWPMQSYFTIIINGSEFTAIWRDGHLILTGRVGTTER